MSRLTIEMAFFEELAEPVEGTEWRVRVQVAGTGLAPVTTPIIAAVGEAPVEGLLIADGGAVGFLREIPAAGSPLRVGYLDTGLEDTDFTYSAAPPDA